MSARLRLLDAVTWAGTPLPGERTAALLAALAAENAGVSDRRLVDLVWGDDPPANPVKALQVLVSRIRSASAADAVERYDGGYRLGLPDADVDVRALGRTVAAARTALAAGDHESAARHAEAAVRQPVEEVTHAGPLAELRADAARQVALAKDVRARALARLGRHTEALPLLEGAHTRAPDDAELLRDLLRSIAARAGPAAALGRYEEYRADLADRLGVDPDPVLQRLHRELLAADAPVRTGVLYEAGDLLGREDDLARLRASLVSGRLTTVLGPGGIGKTRVVQALARESTKPRVHVVELVGVASGDDVVAEVGAALGIRGSVTSRRTLTPAQQADVRARIAQELDAAPALLVLDNCEHVLEPVASLVAFLLVTTEALTVLTTSRAPLRIAAERVVPLSQLADSDAAALFRRRSVGVRPDATLDPETVAAIVARLDGLPLAVELAAARMRTMSAEEVRRALDRRLELLRTRDRTTPERHRTLGAVIEWSWDLLDPPAQRALAWLSVFHDGFDAEAASTLLGPDAPDLVETLVEQSLLVVGEWQGVSRFRALETIREFAGVRLVEAGEQQDALAGQDGWAAALAEAHAGMLLAPDQVERIDRVLAEENNLTDVLRRALGRCDAELVVRLVAALGTLWMVTGNHPRLFAVADAAEEVLVAWDPPPHLRETAREAIGILLVHLSWLPDRPLDDLRSAMERGGVPDTPWARAAYVMYVDPEGGEPQRLAHLAEQSEDPASVPALLLWAALLAENQGDPHEALDYVRRGLRSTALTTYLEASLHAEACQLLLQLGDHDAAAGHARVAWPLLLRIHAVDDALSIRTATALAPLVRGDVDACERILDEVEATSEVVDPASRMIMRSARAEVALVTGDRDTGFRLFDEAVAAATEQDPGFTLSPWLLIAASGALVARVHHAPGPGDARADELRRMLADRSGAATSGSSTFFPDLPVNGLLVVSLAAWTLRYGDPAGHEDAVRLLAIAERWAYNRSLPTLAWPPLAALAERARPGRLDAHLAELAGRPGRDLLPEADTLLARITSAG